MADAEQFASLFAHGEFAVEGDVFVFRRNLWERFQTFGRENLPELADGKHGAAETDDSLPTPSAQLPEIEPARNAAIVFQVEIGQILRKLQESRARLLRLLHHFFHLA